MSRRWQSALLIIALCAAGPSADRARAQCSRGGGFNPGGSPGTLRQTLLQQRQLQQQQQLLQQVQQQQLSQTVQQDRQMRELADKGPDALKAALHDPKPEKRLLAALTVGKHGPPLTDELIELLTDSNSQVRQAARHSLVRINTKAGRRSVDFGPAPDAYQSAQKAAAKKWRTWFERATAKVAERKKESAPAPAAVVPKEIAAPAAAPVDAAQLGKDLIEVPAERFAAALAKLRDGKGVAYTEALAESIPQLTGEVKGQAREALAERLTRMTAATLTDKLRDPNAEVRRAAALACAMKEMSTHVPDLIPLLEDTDPAVPPAARAALKSLTSQDFGSVASSDPAGQARVAAAWKEWWQKRSEP